MAVCAECAAGTATDSWIKAGRRLLRLITDFNRQTITWTVADPRASTRSKAQATLIVAVVCAACVFTARSGALVFFSPVQCLEDLSLVAEGGGLPSASTGSDLERGGRPLATEARRIADCHRKPLKSAVNSQSNTTLWWALENEKGPRGMHACM